MVTESYDIDDDRIECGVPVNRIDDDERSERLVLERWLLVLEGSSLLGGLSFSALLSSRLKSSSSISVKNTAMSGSSLDALRQIDIRGVIADPEDSKV